MWCLYLGAPYIPRIAVSEIGPDHVNATWLPGEYRDNDPRPIGSENYFKYREKGELLFYYFHNSFIYC